MQTNWGWGVGQLAARTARSPVHAQLPRRRPYRRSAQADAAFGRATRRNSASTTSAGLGNHGRTATSAAASYRRSRIGRRCAEPAATGSCRSTSAWALAKLDCADRRAGALIELNHLGQLILRHRIVGVGQEEDHVRLHGRSAARSAARRSVPPSAVMPPTNLAASCLLRSVANATRWPPPVASNVRDLVIEEDDLKLVDRCRAIAGSRSVAAWRPRAAPLPCCSSDRTRRRTSCRRLARRTRARSPCCRWLGRSCRRTRFAGFGRTCCLLRFPLAADGAVAVVRPCWPPALPARRRPRAAGGAGCSVGRVDGLRHVRHRDASAECRRPTSAEHDAAIAAREITTPSRACDRS